MTLPASGPISLTQVMTELRTVNPGRAYPIGLGDSDVLVLAGVAGPANSLSNLYGKTAAGSAGSLVVSSTNGSGSYDSTNSSGTASCNPSVSASGGSGGYTYAWAFTSNPNGCALANATSAACNVSSSFAQGANGSASATLQCTVMDSVSHIVVKSGIGASLSWAYTAMTATGVDAAGSGNSSLGGGTIACSPSVNVTGGSVSKTYSWAFSGSAQGCTLSSATSQTCSVAHTFTKNATGSASPALLCTITDGTGHTVTATATAYLDWGNNQ